MFRNLILTLPFLAATHANAEICNGAYTDAAALLDHTYQQYGTLYSGGFNNRGVGGTLEVYRLLSGLPDAGMTGERPWDIGLDYVDPGYLRRYDAPAAERIGLALMRNLPRISDPEFQRDTATTTTDPEVILNLVLSVGPWPGWWLTPNSRFLPEAQHTVAQFAYDDGLDWLLSVQAASAYSEASWQLARYREPAPMERNHMVYVHGLDRFAETEDLTWLVAAVANDSRSGYWGSPTKLSPHHRAIADRIRQRIDGLSDLVEDCRASDAQYAAFAIAQLERLRVFSGYSGKAELLASLQKLPNVMRDIAAIRLAKSHVAYTDDYSSPWKRISLSEIESLAVGTSLEQYYNPVENAFHSWMNVGRGLRTHSLQELIDLNTGVILHSSTRMLLNLLSAQDLITFARSRDGFPSDERMLFTRGFLRLFALGRDNEAAVLIPELAKLWPQHADDITETWQGSGSQAWRLTQIAGSLPMSELGMEIGLARWSGAMGWYVQSGAQDSTTPFSMQNWAQRRETPDLPRNIRSAAVAERLLDNWLKAVPASPYGPQDRAKNRNIEFAYPHDPVFPQTVDWTYSDGGGLVDYIAWEELAQLGPETGLANRIGREIIQRVRQETSNPIKRLWADEDALAGQLRDVIFQARYMETGTVNGEPLGQVAFRLLHNRFADTDVARQTPYWFVCRDRCVR